MTILATVGWTLAVLRFFGLMTAPAEEPPARGTIRQVEHEGFKVRLDLSDQVLAVSLLTDREFGRDDRAHTIEPELAPSPAALGTGFVSASLLAQKAKQFDDGLYAAAELAAQRGSGAFPGKQAMLRALAQVLAAARGEALGEARPVILGAAQLGGLPAVGSDRVREETRRTIEAFLADPLRSRPLGFYTWAPELKAIFQQDRLLQSELRDAAGVEALARTLHGAGPEVRRSYEAMLRLAERLTNPLSKPDLRPLLEDLDAGRFEAPDGPVCFLPPSRSHEADLVMKLYGNRPIPAGFSLVEALIERIEKGEIDLRPTERSGWYDYQSYALEPLVIPEQMPESKHLRLDSSYRKQLRELFKGLIALTRETHVKQLEIPAPGAAAPGREVVIEIAPELSAEPLVTYYLRRADSYRFVGDVLREAFGAEALAGLHRLTPDGPVAADLARELDQMKALFAGAAVRTARELGMSLELPEGLGDTARAEAEFDRWAPGLAEDADLGRDSRMMVPVFYDRGRRLTKAWVVMGWTTKPAVISFARRPKATILGRDGRVVTKDPPRLVFESRHVNLAYPVFAEIYVKEVLDRDAFRAVCNRYKTASRIIEHLQAGE